MNSVFSAASEFGLPSAFSPNQGGSPDAPSPIATVESSAKKAWFRHPGLALWGLIGVTAFALERTTKPIASAGGSVRVGRAKASAEGEV